jgi:hypothetical protein
MVVIPVEGKHIFLAKDHAQVLHCWRKAAEEGLISFPATVVHIDAHTDFTMKETNIGPSRQMLEMGDASFDAFVSGLAKDNSEYLANAMLGGMVGDAIAVYERTGHDAGALRKGGETSTDRRVLEGHTLYLCKTPNIADLYGYEAYFGDAYHHQDTNELFNKSSRIILDIDLDYFTYVNGRVYMKHPDDIRAQLSSRAFRMLWEKAAIVTIALEPGCCGGTKSCMDILGIFEEVVLRPRGVRVVEKAEELLRRNDPYATWNKAVHALME